MSNIYDDLNSLGLEHHLPLELQQLKAKHRIEREQAEHMNRDTNSRLAEALEEIAHLRRELECREHVSKELTPKSRNTHLRIIAALLEQLKGVEDERPYGVANGIIIPHLERKGRPIMKDETIATVISDARELALSDTVK